VRSAPVSAPERELIRDAYYRALELDPDNRPARFNVAVLDLHAPEGEDAAAKRTLIGLRETAKRPPASGPTSEWIGRLRDRLAGVPGRYADPMWWHTTYALAAEAANAADFEGARALSREGVLAGLRVLTRSPRVRTPMADFVVGATPSMLLLYAGVVAPAKGDVAATETHGVTPAPAPRSSGRALRRLARSLASRLDHSDHGEVVSVQTDLVALVLAIPGSLAPRTRYNLACVYAGMGDTETAAHEFRVAAPGLDQEMLDWATRDPSLASVREIVRWIHAQEAKRRKTVHDAVPQAAAKTAQAPAAKKATARTPAKRTTPRKQAR
jgi:hypothetical protein